MFLRLVAICMLLAVSSCQWFTGDDALVQAKITHQLHGLHNALYSYLESQPAHPVVLPADNGGNGDEAGHPVDTSTEHPTSEHQDTDTTTVCIVSVVDSLLLAPSAEGEELDPATQDAAMRRERMVRQALSASLVENRFFEIIQPTPDQHQLIRLAIIASNSASLAPQEAASAGTEIGVDHLVWALIENEGDDVNVVAQRVDNGVVVFNETLVGWDIFKSQVKAEAE